MKNNKILKLKRKQRRITLNKGLTDKEIWIWDSKENGIGRSYIIVRISTVNYNRFVEWEYNDIRTLKGSETENYKLVSIPKATYDKLQSTFPSKLS